MGRQAQLKRARREAAEYAASLTTCEGTWLERRPDLAEQQRVAAAISRLHQERAAILEFKRDEQAVNLYSLELFRGSDFAPLHLDAWVIEQMIGAVGEPPIVESQDDPAFADYLRRAVLAVVGSRMRSALAGQLRRLLPQYVDAGRLKDAMSEFSFAAEEGARLRSDELRADALVARGELRYYIGELGAAIKDLTEAQKVYVAVKNEARQLQTLNAMANIYAEPRVGEFDRAIEYYRVLLKAHIASNSQALVAEDYFNIGSTLDQQGRPQEALVEFGRGLALDLQRGDAEEVATDRRAIGIVLYKLNRPAEALRMFDHFHFRVKTQEGDHQGRLLTLARPPVGHAKAWFAPYYRAGHVKERDRELFVS